MPILIFILSGALTEVALTRFREQSTGKHHLSIDVTDRRAEYSMVADIPDGKCGEAQKIFIS